MRSAHTDREPAPGFRSLLRPLVALRKLSLDRRLLAGEPPSESAELALRRARLLDPENLRRLADRLERVVEEAWRPARLGRRSTRVPLRRHEIRRNRSVLLALARELREQADPELRGVILVEHLLTDGRSPLYAGELLTGEDERPSIEIAARQARTALTLH